MEPMTEEKAGSRDLEGRVAALEREAATLRRSIADLAHQLADHEVEKLIDELSDRRMSEQEMLEAFERFDAALNARDAALDAKR